MAATPKNSGAPAGFDPASETAEAEATPTTLSVDDIKIEKIEARDLGCKLPVGIFTNDGEHLTEYVLAPYRTKYDRILGQLLQAPKAKITQVLGQFLPQYIQTIGGFTLSELSTKMNGMSPSRIIENMPMGDALSIVVQIRLQAQGEDIAMSAQCPQCGVQNDDDPTKGRPYHDLGSTEVVCFCDLHTKPLIEVVLKDGIERMGEVIKRVHMQPLKLYALEKIATPGSGTPVDIALLYNMITALPDSELYRNVRGQVFSDELYDELTKDDLAALRKAVEKIQPGPDMNADMVCFSCGNEFTSPIAWGNLRSFLFVSPEAAVS